jgi:hypothetical protein
MSHRAKCFVRLDSVAVPDQVAKPLDVDADEVEAGFVLWLQGMDARQRLLDVAHPR